MSAIVPGAQSYTEASSILEGGSNELLRPMVIDWTNGKVIYLFTIFIFEYCSNIYLLLKAVLGDDEAGVKKLVSSLDL